MNEELKFFLCKCKNNSGGRSGSGWGQGRCGRRIVVFVKMLK